MMVYIAVGLQAEEAYLQMALKWSWDLDILWCRLHYNIPIYEPIWLWNEVKASNV